MTTIKNTEFRMHKKPGPK